MRKFRTHYIATTGVVAFIVRQIGAPCFGLTTTGDSTQVVLGRRICVGPIMGHSAEFSAEVSETAHPSEEEAYAAVKAHLAA